MDTIPYVLQNKIYTLKMYEYMYTTIIKYIINQSFFADIHALNDDKFNLSDFGSIIAEYHQDRYILCI